MPNKIYSFLGLAMKAGKLASGEGTCENALKANKASLVIIAKDASDNTKKKFTDMCNYRGIKIKFFGEKELLGRYIGKEIRSVIVIMEQAFANRLVDMIGEHEFESEGEDIVKS